MANDFLSGFLSTSIKSSGNQIFIESKNYAYGSELNFSASFTFGKSFSHKSCFQQPYMINSMNIWGWGVILLL